MFCAIPLSLLKIEVSASGKKVHEYLGPIY